MDTSACLSGVLLLTVLSCCHGQISLKATFNMAGITGDLTLTSGGVDQATSFTFALTGITASVTWELRESWVDLTVENKCADEVIGPRHLPNIGSTLNSGNEAGSLPLATLPDLKTLLGRSVLITTASGKACATLVKESAEYKTGFVRLQDKIIGDVWFRQAAGEGAEILANLFDASATSTVSYSWKIFTGTGTNCSAMTTMFNPTGAASSTCAVDNQAACAIGNLGGKLGPLNVGQTVGSSRKFMHDAHLPLTGPSSVFEKYLVILDTNDKIVSCGMITEMHSMQAQATFKIDGVIGSVKFVQRSPFDATSIQQSVFKLHNAAGGYHVHEYPVPDQIQSSDALCSPDSVGGHWNPFNKPFPTTGATNDLFEIGDLSGKFGSLNGKDSLTGTVQDYNLPLFGRHSIIGRSLVIHKALANAPRWVCANIKDLGPRRVAIATFKSGVIGTVIFSQPQDNPLSDTWIYGELNYADGTDTATTQHMWMVHENMVSDACSSVGGMYNPFNVKKDGDYTTQCKSSNPLRCQVGDGTRQTGGLSIRATNKLAKKFFFSVGNMPLSGSGNIIAKSLVIHAANMGPTILACTNIYHLRTREAIVDSWSTSVTGTFKFSQKHSLINEPTVVKVNVAGMGSLAGKYHVHLFPVPKDSPNKCSDASVGGHYNPYNVNPATSPPPTMGTYDKYEVGDLSGKLGLFENKSSVNDSYADNMLNLFGVRSVVGRSVVIHRMTDGSRWSCGTIREDVSMTAGTMKQARVEFKDTDLTGHAMLTQYSYTDGSMSETSVYVYLNYFDGKAKTMGHKISVGSKPAWKDRHSSSSRCSSTSTTFNPFTVSTQTGYSECNMANPLRCSVGDISGKIGTFDMGEKLFATDVNLPLYGKHSVIGRSLVIGAANGGSGKLACANIMPVGTVSSLVSHDSQSSNILVDMAKKYAEALDTEPFNVAVFRDDEKLGCGAYTVYFMGPHADDLKRTFDMLIQKKDNSLGNFKPTVCAADKTKISVLLVTLVFLCKKVLL